jgi:hypothetical protein
MRHYLEHTTFHVGRRSFLLGTAGTLAVGLSASLTRPKMSEAHAAPLLPPKPIPGGIDVSPLIPSLIHIFVPGPETITLPFTRFTLQGLDVEPSTITDFQGVTAQAYHVGTATGSDGITYNLETDVRIYKGDYIAEDGSRCQGTFAHL